MTADLTESAEALEEIGAWLWAAEAAALAAASFEEVGREDSARRAQSLASRLLESCEDVWSPLLSDLGLARVELTRREREIVSLAADGATNAEIAEAARALRAHRRVAPLSRDAKARRLDARAAARTVGASADRSSRRYALSSNGGVGNSQCSDTAAALVAVRRSRGRARVGERRAGRRLEPRDRRKRPCGRRQVAVGERGVGGGCRERAATDWVQATQAAASIPLGAFAGLIPTGVPNSDRLQLFQLCATALRERAGGERVVLGVDDAHLLDPGSAALASTSRARRPHS